MSVNKNMIIHETHKTSMQGFLTEALVIRARVQNFVQPYLAGKTTLLYIAYRAAIRSLLRTS